MKRLLLLSATSVLLLLGNSALGKNLNPEAVVLNVTAQILKTEASALQIEAPFAKQAHPADALDIVEIIMAVEDALGLEIDDKELDRRIGSHDVEELPQKLTIAQLQGFVRELWEHRKDRKNSKAVRKTG